MTEAPKIDFFMNGLCTHCHIAKNELMDFKEFHGITEASWKKIDQDFSSKLDDLIKKYPENRDEIIEHYSLDFYQHQEKYPSIHRKSLVITIYSFLEAELDGLCAILSQSVNCDLKLRDINGKGIERSLLYLSKLAGFDLSKMGKTLPYIKAINQVRNAIVHNGSILPESPDHPINKFITKQKHISGSPSGTVRFDADFIEELIDVLIQFFEELDAEVQKHIQANIQ